MIHLVVWADVEDADMLGEGLSLAQGRGHWAARLADQERLTQDVNIRIFLKKIRF